MPSGRRPARADLVHDRARRRAAASRRSCRTGPAAPRPPPRRPRAPASRTPGSRGSRRRSARRRRTRGGPAPRRNATESRTIATPSSRSVRSASVTCRSQPCRRGTRPRSRRRGGRAGPRSPRRARPRAGSCRTPSSCACCSVSFVASRKNSVSRGLAPGQPPSTYGNPSWSSLWRIRRRSSIVYDRPGACAPSRSVVSYSSTSRPRPRHARDAPSTTRSPTSRGREPHLAGAHRRQLRAARTGSRRRCAAAASSSPSCASSIPVAPIAASGLIVPLPVYAARCRRSARTSRRRSG